MLLQALTDVVLAHPHEPSVLPAWVWLVSLLAAAASFVVAWAMQQKQRLLRALAEREARLQTLDRDLKAAHEQTRKHERAVDDKRGDVEKLKADLGAQKKKTHQAQEETRAVRGELQSAKVALDAARNARPAFVDEPKPAPAKPEPVKLPPEPVKIAPDVTQELTALRQSVQALEEGRTASEQRAQAFEQEATESSRAVERMRKRIEDYRRIDIMSKSKLEVLEDRLRQMGRQYYDAVSEIAVLRGEVPPMARPAEFVAPAQEGHDAEPGDASPDEDDDVDASPAADDVGPDRVVMSAADDYVAAVF